MKHTHTPGPWQVVYPLADLAITEIRTVANEQTGLVATLGVSFGDGQTQANACLIAAAPELLTALQACLAFWDAPRPTFGCNAARAAELQIIKNLANAAITKAQIP